MAPKSLVNTKKLIEIILSTGSINSAYEAALKVSIDKNPDKIKMLVDIAYQVLKAAEKNHAAALTILNTEIKGLTLECEALRRSFKSRVTALKNETARREKAEIEINSLTAKLRESRAAYDMLVKKIRDLIEQPKRTKSPDVPKHKLEELISLPAKVSGARLAGWTIQLKGGYYRAVRNAGGKSIGVHLGRKLDEESDKINALKKIRAKEAEKIIRPLPMTQSDLAYKIILDEKS